ncbi:hypothetical protein CORC01_13827 [Colletotrichum orchidophilum]|uniref:Uncharacterized protein n=1 Tax=Colletotrichum orchidophilum TaxID=1209926 RepID=A0A1G4APB9_9PEZI|nr:uncharacterized protein CORC01_13827 [Colletotrichum orchidophilum]OHE90882.1 hypothetical protein CORC01_13827 [Colletotrichum orchidophilum]
MASSTRSNQPTAVQDRDALLESSGARSFVTEAYSPQRTRHVRKGARDDSDEKSCTAEVLAARSGEKIQSTERAGESSRRSRKRDSTEREAEGRTGPEPPKRREPCKLLMTTLDMEGQPLTIGKRVASWRSFQSAAYPSNDVLRKEEISSVHEVGRVPLATASSNDSNATHSSDIALQGPRGRDATPRPRDTETQVPLPMPMPSLGSGPAFRRPTELRLHFIAESKKLDARDEVMRRKEEESRKRAEQLQWQREQEEEDEAKQEKLSGGTSSSYGVEQAYRELLEGIKDWKLSTTKGYQTIKEGLDRITTSATQAEQEPVELDSVATEIRPAAEGKSEGSLVLGGETLLDSEITDFTLGPPLSPLVETAWTSSKAVPPPPPPPADPDFQRTRAHPDASRKRKVVYRLVKEADAQVFDVVSHEDAKDPADGFTFKEVESCGGLCRDEEECKKMCICQVSRQEAPEAGRGISRALPLEFYEDDFVLV